MTTGSPSRVMWMSSMSRTPEAAQARQGMNSSLTVPAGISEVFVKAFQPSDVPFQGPPVALVLEPWALRKFIMMRPSCQFWSPTLMFS